MCHGAFDSMKRSLAAQIMLIYTNLISSGNKTAQQLKFKTDRDTDQLHSDSFLPLHIQFFATCANVGILLLL